MQHHAIPEARTKAQAERAEVSEREAIYNYRYNQKTDIGFTKYYDEYYLPWLKEKKRSRVVDAESRVKKLKEFFGKRFLREVTRAALDEFADFNPCSRFEQEPEAKRERYLTPAERTRLMDVLVDDLEVLRAPVEVSLGTGVRKRAELLELRIENVNFTGLAIFRRANGRDVEVRPNWFLLTDSKGKKPRHRLIPMNAPVREALLGVIQNRKTGLVFDTDHTE